MNDRLIKLEMLYSDQSKIIEDLSSELFQQQKEIVQLKLQIEELREQMETPVNEIGGQERPPHY